MPASTRPRPAPATPELDPILRAQIVDAQLAKRRKAMLDEPEEQTALDSQTSAIREGGGGQTVVARGRDKITLYRRMDGVPSEFLYYEVGKVLQEDDNDGKPMWVLDPSQAAERRQGNYLCYLHPEHPDFDRYYAIVGKICNEGDREPKSNLPNAYQQREHMRLKHRRSWDAIQSEEARIRDESDRAASRQRDELLAQLLQRQAGAE